MPTARDNPERRVGRPRGPATDRSIRRSELLDAAARAIRQSGPDVSMDALAAEAGLTKPILYDHFGDRAGLTEALAERYTTRITASVFEALGPTFTARQAVHALVDAFFAFVEEEPEVFQFLARGYRGGAIELLNQRLLVQLGSQLSQMLGVLMRLGGQEPAPAEMWALGFLGFVFIAAEVWRTGGTIPRPEAVDDVTKVIFGGLEAAGPGLLDQPVPNVFRAVRPFPPEDPSEAPAPQGDTTPFLS